MLVLCGFICQLCRSPVGSEGVFHNVLISIDRKNSKQFQTTQEHSGTLPCISRILSRRNAKGENVMYTSCPKKCLTWSIKRSCSSLHFRCRWSFPPSLSTNVSSSYGRSRQIHDGRILQSKSRGPLCYLSFWRQALLQDNHSQVNYHCWPSAWIIWYLLIRLGKRRLLSIDTDNL